MLLPVSLAAEPTAPVPDLDLTFPVYLGALGAKGERVAVLYFRLDQKGVAEAQLVPVRRAEKGFSALPPEERAIGLAEIIEKFPRLAALRAGVPRRPSGTGKRGRAPRPWPIFGKPRRTAK